MNKLDRIDVKILQALQAEGRITNQKLALKVALSPSACLARIRQLEAEGFITGYHARLALERIQPTLTVLAEISLKRHSPTEFARFEAAIGRMPEIVEAAQVSGQYDYLLKVVVPDVASWRELAAQLQNDESGVEKVISHILLKDAKAFRGFPLR